MTDSKLTAYYQDEEVEILETGSSKARVLRSNGDELVLRLSALRGIGRVSR